MLRGRVSAAMMKRMETTLGKRLRVLPALIVVACSVVAGGIGYELGTEHPKTFEITGLENSDKGIVPKEDFAIFWDAWQQIQGSYLRAGEVKRGDMVYGATEGLVGSLKDPYSVFMDPAEAKRFSEDINGNFGGIGAEIGMKNEQIVVIAPLKGSPAEKSGLMSGDKIYEINASSTVNMDIGDAVKKIRGPKGTGVTFLIGRTGHEKPLTVKVVRDTISVPIVEWSMKEGNIAHIEFYTFSEDSAELVRTAVTEARAAGAKGIVLDMRNNPGGYLDAAVAIAGYFMDPQTTVVFEEFRNGKRDTFLSRGPAFAKGMPMAVILNGGSASASEILAGALKDDLNIPIVGEKSFGKGTVQELTELRGGAEIKLTIAHWILPKGTQIDKNGIVPDVAVKYTDADRDKKRDPQLDKALEIVRAKIK